MTLNEYDEYDIYYIRHMISLPEQSSRTFAIIGIWAIIRKFVMFATYFDNFTAVSM